MPLRRSLVSGFLSAVSRGCGGVASFVCLRCCLGFFLSESSRVAEECIYGNSLTIKKLDEVLWYFPVFSAHVKTESGILSLLHF